MTNARRPWKQRLAPAAFMGLLFGVFNAILRADPVWLSMLYGLAIAIAWVAMDMLVMPRRPFRDPVREESIAATEEAIRLAEAEIRAQSERP